MVNDKESENTARVDKDSSINLTCPVTCQLCDVSKCESVFPQCIKIKEFAQKYLRRAPEASASTTDLTLKQRNGFEYVAALPKHLGAVLRMAWCSGRIIVACENGVAIVDPLTKDARELTPYV